jgi:hypothetical protein
MSSSPWEGLRDGDEDVAAPFFFQPETAFLQRHVIRAVTGQWSLGHCVPDWVVTTAA